MTDPVIVAQGVKNSMFSAGIFTAAGRQCTRIHTRSVAVNRRKMCSAAVIPHSGRVAAPTHTPTHAHLYTHTYTHTHTRTRSVQLMCSAAVLLRSQQQIS